MKATFEKRLAALESAQTPTADGMPKEIWIVAANDPECRALLWRAVGSDDSYETIDREPAILELAERMAEPVQDVRESVDRFNVIRRRMIDEDDC